MKERISLKPMKKNRWITVCVAIIATLAVALGALSVYAVLTINEQARIVQNLQDNVSQLGVEKEQLEDDLSQMQDQLDGKQQELEQNKQEMEQKQQELEQSLQDIASQLVERDQKIQEQQSTIDDLKEQIANKKDAAVSVPPSNLPEAGSYNDYKGQKIVALTFDDGPGPYTARLLDEMKKRNVKATFFVLGTRVESYPDLIVRMEQEGHVVGNHSNSHRMLHNMTLSQIHTEMGKCADKIEALLGHKPSVMRCPGGNCSDTVKQYAKDAGVPILYWTVDTRDWESRNVNSILNVAFGKNGIADGSIVLMHDIYSTTVDAAIRMMDRLIADGYTFVTIPELLYARRDGIEAGKVYM